MSLEVNESSPEARERQIQNNLTIMKKYFDLLFTKNLNDILSLIADDIEWTIVATGDVVRGKAKFAEMAKNHWGASPDRVKKLINLFASEDYATIEYTSGGTLTGQVDFGSIKIPASGRKYELQVCFVFHLKNGKIDRVHEYFDMETVKRITGLEPSI